MYSAGASARTLATEFTGQSAIDAAFELYGAPRYDDIFPNAINAAARMGSTFAFSGHAIPYIVLKEVPLLISELGGYKGYTFRSDVKGATTVPTPASILIAADPSGHKDESPGLALASRPPPPPIPLHGLTPAKSPDGSSRSLDFTPETRATPEDLPSDDGPLPRPRSSAEERADAAQSADALQKRRGATTNIASFHACFAQTTAALYPRSHQSTPVTP